ncbi:MAG: hypothetical protein SCARUB_01794 [Candidatus Scalindua rubra]|uniref:Sirohydrochlorin cobaltochelatase n=1 Tax=Candidatus Scalindua rubra TaxID=1872076 RepID=A0A1E3XBT8_9BACT|nr:MAG: hypothetical protein SCARUB_01794 [Candidatus Scalindua rubra]
MKRVILFVSMMFVVFALHQPQRGTADIRQETGFIVVAPDRGYLGNEEVRDVFNDFQSEYVSTLTFVGLGIRNEKEEIQNPLKSALEEIKARNVKRIIVVPLFVSSSDPVFKKAVAALGKDVNDLEFSHHMSESYLISQILYDRVNELSKNSNNERLIVVGFGYTNEEEHNGIRDGLNKLLKYVNERKKFRETKVVVFPDWNSGEKLQEQGYKEALNEIVATAAKGNKTIVVPFFLSWLKADHHMSTWNSLCNSLNEHGLTCQKKELLPHQNVALWLKKTANSYINVPRNEIGVIIMPHGSRYFVNEIIRKGIEPLKERYNVEIAWGMADEKIIQEKVSKLEERGVKKIVLLRLFTMSKSLKEKTEYILGLNESEYMARYCSPVRSCSTFITTGGFDDHSLIAEAYMDRAIEISKDPSTETVLLLAHGASDEEDNNNWLNLLRSLADKINKMTRERHKVTFKAIKVATIREDWPEKRDNALKEIKEIINAGNRDGHTLIIPARVAGVGPYRKYLDGLEYVMNPNGALPHPSATMWMEEMIEAAIKEMTMLGVKLSRTQIFADTHR